ncbi:MAG: 2'-5' RNA ligase family protein [Actinomycetota bacterium]|nr:2'-5' RNA ligase family protein [Actinomycetota bacterium]
MPYEGQTGVAIPVPAANALLASVAGRFPGVVREGVLAHVSVQYPFVTAGELGDRVTIILAELFAGQPPISVTFAQCRRRGGFVYLPPDPIDEVAHLTAQLRQRWPHVVPDAGVDDELGPHLTVAMRASEETAKTIEREVVETLPISTELAEAWLVAFDGKWVLRERFEFGAAR